MTRRPLADCMATRPSAVPAIRRCADVSGAEVIPIEDVGKTIIGIRSTTRAPYGVHHDGRPRGLTDEPR